MSKLPTRIQSRALLLFFLLLLCIILSLKDFRSPTKACIGHNVGKSSRWIETSNSLKMFNQHSCNHGERPCSAPFISGDGFRFLADVIYDETNTDVNLADIPETPIIFVKTDYLAQFFTQVHPKINRKYVLVSHNSDHGVPDQRVPYPSEDIHGDSKILKWYAQNCQCDDQPFIEPIPIGLENRHWKPLSSFQFLHEKSKNAIPLRERKILLYVSHFGSTHPDRQEAASLYMNQSFAFVRTNRISFEQYLEDVSNSIFVLSPRGNGLDCHRTWEAVALGAIPIVPKVGLSRLYQNQNIIEVEDLTKLSEKFLRETLEQIKGDVDSHEQKVMLDYWWDKLRSNLNDEGHRWFRDRFP